MDNNAVIIVSQPGTPPRIIKTKNFMLIHKGNETDAVMAFGQATDPVFEQAAFRTMACNLASKYGAEKVGLLVRQATKNATLYRISNPESEVTIGMIGGNDR